MRKEWRWRRGGVEEERGGVGGEEGVRENCVCVCVTPNV